ncbi:MAG TPA: glycosyltransferase [Candidatus Saccharimonadales bacterium]|nr:glycosyltransferase [Candidatus Saccharimonadales bacterium]
MKLTMLGSGSAASTLSIRLVALARHLGVKNWNVSVILPSADKYNNFTSDPQAAISHAKLVQPWQPKTKSAMANLLPYLCTSFAAFLRTRPDVVYLYKPTPITIVGILARLASKPVLLDLDDLGSEVMKAQGQAALQYRLVAWCERLALRYCSAVVVTSTYLETLVRRRFPNKPILVLPNGVEPEDYTKPAEQAPRHGVYYFGAVNRLSLIETLLRAVPLVVQSVPDVQVTIVGGGSALEDATQLVKELGIEHAVRFTGWTAMLEAQQYTQFADLAVCCQPDTPTVRAASNMKVFQYMAMSTVPVVSDVGDLALYCKNGTAGVVVPADDERALADALTALLLDLAKRARLAHTGRRLAETEYAWATRTQQLDAFIRGMGAERKDVL